MFFTIFPHIKCQKRFLAQTRVGISYSILIYECISNEKERIERNCGKDIPFHHSEIQQCLPFQFVLSQKAHIYAHVFENKYTMNFGCVYKYPVVATTHICTKKLAVKSACGCLFDRAAFGWQTCARREYYLYNIVVADLIDRF